MSIVLGALVLLAQANPKTPDFFADAKLGVSVQKPPKKEEWEFKSAGVHISNANLAVSNKVEGVAVEILVLEQGANPRSLNSNDIKAQVEAELDAQKKSPNFTSVTQKKLAEEALPGKGAGGVKAWLLEMAIKDKNGGELEWRIWTFMSKENKCLVKVNVLGPAGIYEKNKKDLDYILSTLRTFKQAKS